MDELLLRGMVIPPFMGNPYNRHGNPYFWDNDPPVTIAHMEVADFFTGKKYPSSHNHGLVNDVYRQ